MTFEQYLIDKKITDLSPHIKALMQKAWGAATEIERAKHQPISVEERLPPAGERVLFYDGNETVANKPNIYHVDYIAHDKSDTVVNYLHNYTHWLPIPELPA